MLPFYNSPRFDPLFLSSKEAEEKITHKIAPFSFRDQNNKTINISSLSKKIHVANFMFTQCGSICPIMTSHLKMIEEAYGENPNLSILSFSVTPWIDSVSRLKSYADQYDIKMKQWHFLTGETASVYALARGSYFAEEELGFTKDSSDFLHTEHVLLVDKQLRLRGIYNGTLQLEIEQLRADIQSLLLQD